MITVSRIIIWSAYLLSLYFLVFWLLVYLDKGVKSISKSMSYFPNVTIAIPAYNEQDNIKAAITSVANLDYPKDKMEIIVVNDGSKDNTKEKALESIRENKLYNIKLVNQENKGKGAALNHALRLATGEIFVCLDADSVVKESTLKRILAHFEDEETAVVLPLMKVKEKSTLLQKLQWCEYLLNFFYKKLMGHVDCITVAPGPFSVYKTELLRKIGYFDEHNLTEDQEIALRLQKQHYKIKQVLDAEVYTNVPSTFKGFYRQRNRWYKGTVLNMVRYRSLIFNKKYGDFGMMQMPYTAASGIIAIIVFSVVFFEYLIRPLLRYLSDLSYINYNLIPQVSRLFSNLIIFDVNITNIFLAIVSITLGFIFVTLAYKNTNENLFGKASFIAIPTYYIAYASLAAIVWFGVIIEMLFGKIQRW